MARLRELNAYGLTLTVAQIAQAVGKNKKTVYATLFNSYGGDAVAYLEKHGIYDTVELANRLSGARKAEDENRETAAAVDEIMGIIADGAEEAETNEEKKVIKEIMSGEEVSDIDEEAVEPVQHPVSDVKPTKYNEDALQLMMINSMIDTLERFQESYKNFPYAGIEKEFKQLLHSLEEERRCQYSKCINWNDIAERMLKDDAD